MMMAALYMLCMDESPWNCIDVVHIDWKKAFFFVLQDGQLRFLSFPRLSKKKRKL